MAVTPIPLQLSRRAFLGGVSALAAASALPAFPLPARARDASEAAWRGLADRLAGSLLRPGDRSFEVAAEPFNLRYAGTLPGGIALCRDAEDVATAIGWARENDVPLVARSGGHSYAGYSTTTGLMISLTEIDHASHDASTGIVSIGGGVRNFGLYAALEQVGATLTHGRCPTVGAAGFLLGGGIGFNMRLFGVASDHLVSTDIVTADGTILTASARENSDLFWACRGGGGGNFGINTGFRVNTFPAGPRAYFILRWQEPDERLLAALLAALEQAPPELGSRLSLDTYPDRPGIELNLIGQLDGSKRDVEDILAPALAMARPGYREIEEADYWTVETALLDDDGPFSFSERSRFVIDPLGEEFAAAALDWLRRWPGTGDGGHVVLFQTGGRINDTAPDATAFVHRDSRWLAVVAASWLEEDQSDVVERALDWQAAVYGELKRHARGGAYQNFTDPALEDWAEAYYGANLPRLRQIKRLVDPDNVFRFPQSIPPA